MTQVSHYVKTPAASRKVNFTYQNTKMSIATDLGHVTDETFQLLQNSKFVMLESNYDPEVLRCCSYPYLLKSRIAGPKGHLSNSLAGKTISKLIDSGLTSAMLGHLSKETNFPELAYHTVLEEMQASHHSSKAIDLFIANRLGPTKLVEIA